MNKNLQFVLKLAVAIVVGIVIGQPFMPEIIARLLITASSLFGSYLMFVIPLMILAYITMGI